MKSANETTMELVPTSQPSQSLPVASTDQERVLSMIERMGTDPNVDIGKMERAFALYKEMVQAKEMREFNEAMLAVQSKTPAIVKTSNNPSTNSKYAKLENIQAVLAPLLLENRLTIAFGTDHSPLPEHYGVTCLVSRGGFERLFRCDVPCDNIGMKGNPTKTKTHGFGSALSYGERYLLKLVFNIRLIGEDDDGTGAGRQKPQGPSSLAGEPDVKALTRELWNLLAPVRGKEQNWKASNQWLWREEIIDAAAEESVPHLSAKRFAEVIAKCKAHPELKG